MSSGGNVDATHDPVGGGGLDSICKLWRPSWLKVKHVHEVSACARPRTVKVSPPYRSTWTTFSCCRWIAICAEHWLGPSLALVYFGAISQAPRCPKKRAVSSSTGDERIDSSTDDNEGYNSTGTIRSREHGVVNPASIPSVEVDPRPCKLQANFRCPPPPTRLTPLTATVKQHVLHLRELHITHSVGNETIHRYSKELPPISC